MPLPLGPLTSTDKSYGASFSIVRRTSRIAGLSPTSVAPDGGPACRRNCTTNGLAIASLVLGAVGLVACGITAIPGLILGIIAINQINNSPVRQEGKGLAIAGTVISAIVIVISLIGLAFLLSLDEDDFDDDPVDDDSFPALVVR